MYAIPISDTTAFAIDDLDPTAWRLHYIGFEPVAADWFEAEAGGAVVSATRNPATEAVWMLSRGRLYAASRPMRVVVPLPFAETGVVPFDVCLIGTRYYVATDNASLWYFDREAEAWVNVRRGPPRPEMPPRADGETSADYVRRTSPPMYAHARSYPDLYKTFAVGTDVYSIGALGLVLRIRGDAVTEMRLDSGARLVTGHEEDGQAILCGDDPVAEIYIGTPEIGFELLFQHDNKALHLTAVHEGQRYIGAALSPDHSGPCLYKLVGDELVPVITGCVREPGPLSRLVSTGGVLWAIDEGGFFRLNTKGWSLVELNDPRLTSGRG